MKHTIQFFIVPIVFSFFTSNLFSQTTSNTHTGYQNKTLKTTINNGGNIIWKDTVYITENITIKKDSTLLIEKGTSIILQGHYRINVNGKISANGTKAEPILFTVSDTSGFYNNDTGDGGWGGFYISGSETSPKSIFNHCIIEYGKKVFDDVSDNGGAIKITNHQNLEIKNCTFRNNKAFAGGALYCGNSKISISQNDVYNNESISGSGGAFYLDNSETLLSNNVIHHNTARTRGGAMFIIYSDKNFLVNNTICHNTALEKGGGIMFLASAEIYNTILYYNSAREGAQGYIDNNITNDVAPSFFNCNIQEGQYGLYFVQDNFPGIYENNIEVDPEFMEIDTFNYRLSPISPCIDAGTHTIFDFDFDEKLKFDKDGKYRRIPGNEGAERVVDIGAYEFGSPEPMTLSHDVVDVSILGLEDGSISLFIAEGQKPYSILWETGDTTAELTNLKTDTYRVTVTDFYGYQVSEYIHVHYDSVITNPVSQFSIHGSVYKQDTLVQSGVVLAFKKTNNTVLLQTTAPILKGNFLLNNLDSSDYIIQALPTPGLHGPYLPTFYSSYAKWENADIVNVFGKIYGLDIHLQTFDIQETGDKSISGNVLYEDTTSFMKSLFEKTWFEGQNDIKSDQIEKAAQNIPVVLMVAEKTVAWTISDKNGYFEFLNLSNGIYNAEAKKAGLNTTFSPVLTINNEKPVVEGVKIIIRKNDIITTYEDNYKDFEYSLNLYPSITNRDITIDFNYYDILDYSLYIYDARGSLVLSDIIQKPEGESKQTYNLETFASGYYWVKVAINENKENEQTINKKFIKY